MVSTAAGSRPGGRNARVTTAIYSAVGELVGEGADGISFRQIALRAGVNPTTLYRRWRDVNALLEEVAAAALTHHGDSPRDTGSVWGDLLEWATVIATDITRPERTRFLRAMVAARIELISECAVTDARRRQAKGIIERAASRGEQPPTVEQILDHVIAPLYYRVVFALPVEDDRPHRLVRDVLSMASAEPNPDLGGTNAALP